MSSLVGSLVSVELGSVLVIAKEPVPGRVKTRLTPPFTPAQAATLAAAALADTLRAASRVPARQHVLVLDGRLPSRVVRGWRVVPQSAGELDVRLAAAFAAVAGDGPAVLVGMDTPQLRAEQLAAFRTTECDSCLGLAGDGGYWAIGFTDPGHAASVVPGVRMSREDTGAEQLGRLRAAGLSVQLLDELVDADTAETAQLVAAQAPDSDFARRLRVMSPQGLPRPNPQHAAIR